MNAERKSTILKNKANLAKPKMNASSIITKDYENKSAFSVLENKPKQSQNAGPWPEARSTKPEILNRPVAVFSLTSGRAEGYNEFLA